MFLPDEPIENSDQDDLNRTNFVKDLAKKITKFDQPNCMVIGIHGPWGSGKSSFLNLLANELEEKNKDKNTPIVIIRFNPWNFSTIDQLIFMFFNEIKYSIGQKDRSKTTKRIGEKLDTLGKLLAPLQVFPVLGEFPKSIQKFSEGLKRIADSNDLIDLKTDLNRLFDEYSKKLVILIDDIDRLDKESMRLMFRLIRLNADFRNTVYTLAFDRQVVEKVLENEQEISGRDYLEKIIQVNFDLPSPEHSRVTQFLTEEIVRILSEIPEEDFDVHRWLNIYHAGFKLFFKNIRDVKRYVNALQLTLLSVYEEVNPIDFVALEAIRVFCPDIYSDLAKKKETLTKEDLSTQMIYGESANTEEREEFEELFAKAGKEYEPIVRRICQQLFPHISNVYSNMFGGDGSPNIQRKEKRICTKDFFDKYFLLGVPEGGISEVEFRIALEKADNRNIFVDILEDLNKRGLARKFLERLGDFVDDISIEKVKTITEALLDVGDELPLRRKSLLDFGPQSQISWIAYRLLKRMDDPLSRVDVLRDAVRTGVGLYSVIHLVSKLEIENKKEENQIIPEKYLKELQNIALERIRQETKEGKLLDRAGLAYILYRWKSWSNTDEPNDYISRIISNDKEVVKLLVGFLEEVISETGGDYFARRSSVIRWKSLSEFVNPQDILHKVQSIKQRLWKSLSDREKIAVDAFLSSKPEQIDE